MLCPCGVAQRARLQTPPRHVEAKLRPSRLVFGSLARICEPHVLGATRHSGNVLKHGHSQQQGFYVGSSGDVRIVSACMAPVRPRPLSVTICLAEAVRKNTSEAGAFSSDLPGSWWCLRQRCIKQAYGDSRNCPMKGRRLPELVDGELQRALDRVMNLCSQRMLLRVRVVMSGDEWDKINADFEAARSHAAAALHIKFDFTRRLPWSLAGLALACPTTARAHGRRLVAEFEEAPEGVRQHHHMKTMFFLKVGGPLRALLDQFIDGVPLTLLPLLEFHIGSLRFINIVERWIEASHSLVKQCSGRSGVYVSLVRRLPEMNDTLQRRQESIRDLAAAFEQVRRVSLLPGLLGLQRHPIFEACSPFEMHHGAVVKHLRKLIYRADITGQFQDVCAAARHHTSQASRKKRQAAVSVAAAQGHGALGGVAAELSEEHVVRRTFLEHFRNVLSDDNGQSFFTLPAVAGQTLIGEPVERALQPTLRLAGDHGHRQHGACINVDIEDGGGMACAIVPTWIAEAASAEAVPPRALGVELAELHPGDFGTDLVFRVAKANPSNWHIVQVPLGVRSPS